MKLITAIIRESKLDQVRETLIEANITRITVSRVSGHGRSQESEEDIYRGQRVVPNLTPKIRLDIAVNEAFVEVTCNTILENAREERGRLGDGKIFIMPLEECIRIRTAEKGSEAI